MTYTPFSLSGQYPSGTVADLPWRGRNGTYPDGMEDFRGYDPQPGEMQEIACANNKGACGHMEVTSGCLDAVRIGSENQYTRGRLRCPDEDFRALALGYAPGSHLPIKWTDCGIQFRFHGHQTRETNYPGVKAFMRYRSEDDLYVASWRFDGVVQIQRKWGGSYSVLASHQSYGAPSPDEWHWFALEAKGSHLRLELDDQTVLTASSATFSWGTAGIRIDGADGMYLDEWGIYQPE